jgi:hypothetical protein
VEAVRGGGKGDLHLPGDRVARFSLVEQAVAALHPLLGQLAVRRLVVRIGRIEFLDLLLDQTFQALKIGFDRGDEVEERLGIQGSGLLSCRNAVFPFRIGSDLLI